MTEYRIKSKVIDDLYDKAEELQGNISLIRMFCEQYYDVDEFYKIKALIKHTDELSDRLYLDLINLKAGE